MPAASQGESEGAAEAGEPPIDERTEAGVDGLVDEERVVENLQSLGLGCSIDAARRTYRAAAVMLAAWGPFPQTSPSVTPQDWRPRGKMS